jgi:hypothetical protein
MFQDGFYIENEGLTGNDVKAFAMEKPGKKTK